MTGPDVAGRGPDVDTARAARALRAGEVVVVPTDTVYGLAADAFRPEATEALFTLKRRPEEVALPVLVASVEQALALAADDLPAIARRLMRRWWPGPLTLVLPRRPGLGLDLGGSDDTTIGVRLPDHPVPTALAAAVGPLAVTSANLHGGPTPATVSKVLDQLGRERDLVALDGGALAGRPSTVVSCLGGRLRVLREGTVPTVDLLAVASDEQEHPH